MNRNVMIFGAGISKDAGIPLLGSFIDCMLEMGSLAFGVVDVRRILQWTMC